MIMFAYANTPKVFPTPNCGRGSGIASCLIRVAGLMTPIIGIYAGTNSGGPIYAAGALVLAAFVSGNMFLAD